MHMKCKQSGAALVEFALILPFLLILSFMTFEFGRALYQYNVLTKSVRDAARYLSTQQPWTSVDANTTENIAVKTIAKNLVVFGNPAGAGNPLAVGLSVSKVPNPTWDLVGAAPEINTVTIKITGYTFTPIIASAFGLRFMPDAGLAFADITATMRGSL